VSDSYRQYIIAASLMGGEPLILNPTTWFEYSGGNKNQ